MDNVIGKLLSEPQKLTTTANSGGLETIERNLEELFSQEEKHRQAEREAAWNRIERGEAEPSPEMTDEERELAELAAMYGNDDDEEQEKSRVHEVEDDRDQSRHRGRGR